VAVVSPLAPRCCGGGGGAAAPAAAVAAVVVVVSPLVPRCSRLPSLPIVVALVDAVVVMLVVVGVQFK